MIPLFLVPICALECAPSALHAQAQSSVAGQWSQSSDGSELVLVPKFKLQPNVGVTWGTNLGGSVGYGSMTRTTIVTDPVPLRVARRMRLNITGDGRFTWTTIKSHPETPGGSCIKATRTERLGQASLAGGRIRFAIQGGTESWEKSCGGSGSSAIAAGVETYTLTLSPGEMRLSDGPSVWKFRRG